MSLDLKKYLTEQYHRTIAKGQVPGPVITISRQYGCSAKEYARLLGQKLNELKKDQNDKTEWAWINKEIFVKTARELNLKESRIIHVFEGQKKGMIDSILLSASEKYYTSDSAILKKIIEVIRSFAEDGHIIIIGLGSVAITRDIEKSLHIRLEAPFKWRVEQASIKYGKSIAETEKITIETDLKRDSLKKMYIPKSDPDELFDITYNISTLDKQELVDSILCILKKRNMI
jgi:cytidylate kinase